MRQLSEQALEDLRREIKEFKVQLDKWYLEYGDSIVEDGEVELSYSERKPWR